MDVTNERDLFKQLLELGTQDEVDSFLKEALSLIVTMTGARRGYIELWDDGGWDGQRSASGSSPPERSPRFWMAHGWSDIEVEKIRETFSSGIIGAALATGTTISTSSAQEDPRFRDRGSVRRNRIEAVLCAPIGATTPFGVLYLQDRGQPGPFTDEDCLYAKMFTRYLAAFADRLLIRRYRLDATDPTLPFRSKLAAADVIGRSHALAHLLKEVSLVAPLEINVLLTGPIGTGKTQIAQVIHASGPRAAKPFLEISCATLPEPLFENELFGAVQGAHSGGQVEGKVAAAQGGTLFLDEIAELTPGSQAKLLQLLQSKEYFRLGSSRSMKADIRVIAATKDDLKERIAQGRFRDDLYSRLDVMNIHLPSLAERREDIVDLAAFFCRRACKTHGFRHLTLSVGARYAIETAEWPGNIRELDHKIEVAVIRANGDGVHQIERRHIFPAAGAERDAPEEHVTLQSATFQFQAQLLRKTLEDTNWNVVETAKRLDIGRSSIYNMIKAHGIKRPRS